MLGTDFPYRQFYPRNARIAQIDIRPENLGRRANIDLGVVADVGEALRALLPLLKDKDDSKHLQQAQEHYRKARRELDELAVGAPTGKRLHAQQIARVISERAAADAIFTCDVGLPMVWAARYLAMNGKRRLVGSFHHGSMANAMAQALGAQVACPGRQVISLSGDGGFTMLMGDLLSLKQLDLPVKLVIFNNGSLGFVAMEMKAGGYLDTNTDLDNPSFAAVAEAAGIRGIRIENPADLEGAAADALACNGPVLLDVVTAKQELVIPPRIQLEQAKGFSLFLLKAILNGRGDEVVELARTNLRR